MIETKTLTATLVGTSPLQFGKAYLIKKASKESHEAFEQRTWRERMHRDEEGYVMLPSMAVKKALENYAIYCSDKIPGHGKATFTKHYKAGIMPEEIFFEVESKGERVYYMDVEGESHFLPVSKSAPTRVMRIFPTIQKWEVKISFIILDPILFDSPKIIEEHLNNAGVYIGLLVWRPQNGGNNGRFEVEDFKIE